MTYSRNILFTLCGLRGVSAIQGSGKGFHCTHLVLCMSHLIVYDEIGESVIRSVHLTQHTQCNVAHFTCRIVQTFCISCKSAMEDF